jgi:CheY-like chemotaxis protein
MAKRVREVLGPVAAAVRILVADDDPEVRAFLRLALEQGGYDVVEAEDGGRAMEMLMDGGIDLVLMDLVMPGQEGIETIQAIRKEMPDTRVIAISGGFGGQFLGVAKMLGADATLEKPIPPSALLEKVGEVLQLRRSGVSY